MKKQFITSLAIVSLLSTASFAVADNYQTTNTYAPSGGSLSNTLSANGNSASNNGMIGTSSSAYANKLDSSISNVSRLENTNQQFGNSSASLGNISNNSAGGYATSNSGGNTLSNGQGQGQDQQMGQGQGQSASTSGNSTNTSFSDNSSSVVNIPRQAPPLPAQVQVQAPGTSGGNFGFTTPFGGISLGMNRTVKEAKKLLEAQTEETYQRSNSTYVENVKAACQILSEEDCADLKMRMMNRF